MYLFAEELFLIRPLREHNLEILGIFDSWGTSTGGRASPKSAWIKHWSAVVNLCGNS